MYTRPIVATAEGSPEVRIVETDIDLYYHMAIEIYRELAVQKRLVCILPVGPVFYLRRLVWLIRTMPIDCNELYLFFMDEYLDAADHLIAPDDPLSFRGFVRRELVEPLAGTSGFQTSHVHFPDPDDPRAYDDRISELGGTDLCLAGVGINGHLAFNEPPQTDDPQWRSSGTRIVNLSRETIAINSNTALGGAWEVIPGRAITVGIKQILESRRLMVYLNRPWQRAVVRKILYGPVTATFPASYARDHDQSVVTMTRAVAEPPQFGLR